MWKQHAKKTRSLPEEIWLQSAELQNQYLQTKMINMASGDEQQHLVNENNQFRETLETARDIGLDLLGKFEKLQSHAQQLETENQNLTSEHAETLFQWKLREYNLALEMQSKTEEIEALNAKIKDLEDSRVHREHRSQSEQLKRSRTQLDAAQKEVRELENRNAELSRRLQEMEAEMNGNDSDILASRIRKMRSVSLGGNQFSTFANNNFKPGLHLSPAGNFYRQSNLTNPFPPNLDVDGIFSGFCSRDIHNHAELASIFISLLCNVLPVDGDDEMKALQASLFSMNENNTNWSLGPRVISFQDVCDHMSGARNDVLSLPLNDLYRTFHRSKDENELVDGSQFGILCQLYNIPPSSNARGREKLLSTGFCGFHDFVSFLFSTGSNSLKRGVANVNTLVISFRDVMNRHHTANPNKLQWIARTYELRSDEFQKLLQQDDSVTFSTFLSACSPEYDNTKLDFDQLLEDFISLDPSNHGYFIVEQMCSVNTGIFPESNFLELQQVFQKICTNKGSNVMCFKEYIAFTLTVREEVRTHNAIYSLPQLQSVTIRSIPPITISNIQDAFDSIETPRTFLTLSEACIAVSKITGNRYEVSAELIDQWMNGTFGSRFSRITFWNQKFELQQQQQLEPLQLEYHAVHVTFEDLLKLCSKIDPSGITVIKTVFDECSRETLLSTNSCQQQQHEQQQTKQNSKCTHEANVAVILEYLEPSTALLLTQNASPTQQQTSANIIHRLVESIRERDQTQHVSLEQLVAWIRDCDMDHRVSRECFDGSDEDNTPNFDYEIANMLESSDSQMCVVLNELVKVRDQNQHLKQKLEKTAQNSQKARDTITQRLATELETAQKLLVSSDSLRQMEVSQLKAQKRNLENDLSKLYESHSALQQKTIELQQEIGKLKKQIAPRPTSLPARASRTVFCTRLGHALVFP
eukprot:c8816_g1_i1.p1 GENE.c8816_g1_i1~~c8816_g1_i1.p1  ORF type:complete len:925 (+),score=243.43 c8816_g1_i1:30-2804(+)